MILLYVLVNYWDLQLLLLIFLSGGRENTYSEYKQIRHEVTLGGGLDTKLGGIGPYWPDSWVGWMLWSVYKFKVCAYATELPTRSPPSSQSISGLFKGWYCGYTRCCC